MRLREQSSSLIVSVVAVLLAALAGLLISISGGGTRRAANLDWTPPVTPSASVQADQRTATVIPARYVTQTSTPRPKETAAPTLPAPTDTPAASPTGAPQVRIASGPVNLRSGPNTAAGVIGLAKGGEAYEILGRSEDEGWVKLCCVNRAPFWVATNLVELPAALEVYPISALIWCERAAPLPEGRGTAVGLPTSVICEADAVGPAGSCLPSQSGI